jgi:O-antigen ligase
MREIVPIEKNISSQRLLMAFALITSLSLWTAAAIENPLPAAMPVLILLAYVAIVDFRRLFFLLLLFIPFSMEYTFPNGFGTDLPTEPLMVSLMLIYMLYIFRHGLILSGGRHLKSEAQAEQNARLIAFTRHPFSVILYLILAWGLVTTLNSQDVFLSVKYYLAKIWYVVTFYCLAHLILKEQKDYTRFFWILFIPLSMAVLITTLRHAATGFSFKEVNYVMQPMFRNHVTYGCLMAVFLPFTAMGLAWYWRQKSLRYFILFGFILFVVAIQLSFTRAAYGAVLGALGYYFIVKYRLTKTVVVAAIMGIIFLVGYLTYGDRYLDFAPKYERAITHNSFDNLLEATAKGEDISTMERVYRWVAGFRMVAERPLTGFGPNNFYNFYKTYTVTKFRTYVSDNPDQSTVHCYYLLAAIEQGIPGFILFCLLVFVVLLRGERIYHQATEKWQKELAMASLLSFVIILILNLINDLIETDKIGSFFFMTMAILVYLDNQRNRPPQYF